MDLSTRNTSIQLGESLEQIQVPQTHPISQLPPEIISEIFLHFLPAYPERPEHPGLSSPLLLCAICREWRAIAIGTPQLWRAVRMSASDDSRAEQLELLSAWLSYSGSCPLSFNIPFRSYSWRNTLESQLLQMVVPHSGRWEHADLCLTFENLHFLQCDMPLLRRLTFGLNQAPPLDGPPVNLFDCAPQLKDVVLTTSFEKSIMNLPWHQLTHLQTHYLYLEECVEILRDAVSLVCCDFGVCGTEELIPIPTLPVHHHLTRLALQLTENTSYYLALSLLPLFENLTTPALHSLHVYEPGITLRSLEAFFSRSRCSLQELRVDESSMAENVYRDAFPFVNRIIVEEP
ncbi:F-box domain-containing protein [Mycena sanguinolenta]|uniref:F-box domain-containing protein n=1 Tax=Mycena sanguinolenta TaxID=230812 RepID=A0A8H6YS21_9AGAR|nr:F-box domain-containing protein [Mycena sanguinolenta]